jgi:hypothetical protein
MALVALDRIVLHTAMHPYFNQTWGFFALPFALVVGPVAVRERSRGGLLLFALFLAVLGLAYPLALPIPLLAVAAAARFQGALTGDTLRAVVPRSRRSLLWVVPLVLVALIPLYGVAEKAVTAAGVVLPGSNLGTWGGDLTTWLPWEWFAAAGSHATLVWIVPAILVGTVLALRRAPRDVQLALGSAIAFGLLFAVYFRIRDHGWYFHFKVLAFTAPIAITCAAVGLGRLRYAGPVILGVWLLVARAGAAEEVRVTSNQLPQTILDVRKFDRALPPGASVRLDMKGNLQIWVNYFLSGQPTCSQTPLIGTQYPHVPYSRRADYVVADARRPRPADAVGPRLGTTGDFDLYRLRAGLPGPEVCSRQMVQTVTSVT